MRNSSLQDSASTWLPFGPVLFPHKVVSYNSTFWSTVSTLSPIRLCFFLRGIHILEQMRSLPDCESWHVSCSYIVIEKKRTRKQVTDYGPDIVDRTSYVSGRCSAQLGLSQIGFRAIGYRRCGAAGRRYFAFDRSALSAGKQEATQGTGVSFLRLLEILRVSLGDVVAMQTEKDSRGNPHTHIIRLQQSTGDWAERRN